MFAPKTRSKGKLVFYTIPLIIFFFCVAPGFVQKSMYNDGIWYAIVSNNLAEGVGSFWTPRLTETIFPEFHEHPPLVFGIQSLFFKLLGDSLVVERIYAFFMFLLSAFLIISIWQWVFRAEKEMQQLWFLPLTMWLLNEVVFLFYPGNILEPTMGVFTLAGVYCLLRSASLSGYLQAFPWIAASGLLLIGATLCKGFVGLFPLAVLGIHWLVFRDLPLGKVLVMTFMMLGVFLLGYLLLLTYPNAMEGLQQYIDNQVVASIKESRTTYHHRENRLYIIKRLFEVLLPAILISLLLIYLSVKKKPVKFSGSVLYYSPLFILIGVSASFPLVISPKQSFYYLLPSIPYFAIGLAIAMSPITLLGVQYIQEKRRYFSIFKTLLKILLCVSIVFSVSKFGSVSERDKVVLSDIEKMGEIIPHGTTVASKGYSAQLVGYLFRFYQINIDTNNINYPYLIIDEEEYPTLEMPTFKKEELGTKQFHLYVRKQ